MSVLCPCVGERERVWGIFWGDNDFLKWRERGFIALVIFLVYYVCVGEGRKIFWGDNKFFLGGKNVALLQFEFCPIGYYIKLSIFLGMQS